MAKKYAEYLFLEELREEKEARIINRSLSGKK